MSEMNFNEEDKQKIVDFLNMVATYAEFTLKTPELVKYYGLLSFMQHKILKKIDANIFEVKRVVEPGAEGNKE